MQQVARVAQAGNLTELSNFDAITRSHGTAIDLRLLHEVGSVGECDCASRGATFASRAILNEGGIPQVRRNQLVGIRSAFSKLSKRGREPSLERAEAAHSEGR